MPIPVLSSEPKSGRHLLPQDPLPRSSIYAFHQHQQQHQMPSAPCTATTGASVHYWSATHSVCSRGEDDYDWGCVYRSAQTVLAAMGEPIPTLVELAQLMGHGPAMEAFLLDPTKEGQRRHLWVRSLLHNPLQCNTELQVEPHDIALALATRSPHLKVRVTG